MHLFRYIIILCFPIIAWAQADDVQEQLFEQIKQNHFDQVVNILTSEPNLADSVYAEDQFLRNVKKHPIHQAIIYADKEILSYLLAHGADASKKLKATSIMHATTKSCFELMFQYRNLEYIRYFHDKIPVLPEDYIDALRLSSEEKNEEKLRYLLKKGEYYLLRYDK